MSAFRIGAIHWLLASFSIILLSCRTVPHSGLTNNTKNPQPKCFDTLEGKTFKLAFEKRSDNGYMVVKKGDGFTCTIGSMWSEEYPKCKDACGAQQQQNSDWGWCNSKEFKCGAFYSEEKGQDVANQEQKGNSGGGIQLYDSTFYPFNKDEETSYSRTTCGDGMAHDQMYFAVTEKSPVWTGECNNESWQTCDFKDCLDKWDKMPSDAKKMEKGVKKVRAPACDVPCGEKHVVYNEDKSIKTTAVIWDACPSQHWNNRFKEVTEGKNPCAKGKNHVDLRINLYLKLNNGKRNSNIKIHIDSAVAK